MFISSFENNYILLSFFASLLDENDKEQTLSATEMEDDISSSNSPNANVTKGEESMDVCNSDDDNVDKEQKQETGTERNERLLKEIKSIQDVLNRIEKRNSVCSEYFNQERVLVDVSIIMDSVHHSMRYKAQIMMFYQSRFPKQTDGSSSSMDILCSLCSLLADSPLMLLVSRVGSNW